MTLQKGNLNGVPILEDSSAINIPVTDVVGAAGDIVAGIAGHVAKARSPIVCDTVEEMQALTSPYLINGQTYQTLRYSTSHSYGDGSGNLYRWVAGDSTTADGGFVVAGTGGRFHAVDKSVANVMQFGAVGDGVTDDTAAIQAAIDAIVAIGGGEVRGAAGKTFATTDTITLYTDVVLDLRKSTIVQGTDDTAIVNVCGATFTSRWVICNGTIGYASQQTSDHTNSLGILLAESNQRSYLGRIQDLHIYGAYEGISLPSNEDAFAFLIHIKNVYIRNTASYVIEITGDAAGGHTNFLLEGVWGHNSNDIETMQGFLFNGINGLRLDAVGCDHLQTIPVVTAVACFGDFDNVWSESLTHSRSSSGAGIFQFSGSRVQVGSVHNFSPTVTLTGSGYCATLRAISNSHVDVRLVQDMQTKITDSSTDNYYTMLASSDSVVRNEVYRTTQASGTAPSQSFAEFTNDAKLVTGVYKFNGDERRAKKGGKNVSYGTAAPTANAWAVGDIVYNTAPTAGGTLGWVCTTAGSPGTWKTFGAISA